MLGSQRMQSQVCSALKRDSVPLPNIVTPGKLQSLFFFMSFSLFLCKTETAITAKTYPSNKDDFLGQR